VEATRLSALSRVHDLIESQLENIKTQHMGYLEHSSPYNDFFYPSRVLANSLLFGYFALAKESWFYPDGARSHTDDFSGVSFSGLVTNIRSMITLEEYMIASVPPSHRLPEFVSAVSSFVT
jgi:hypothetical protein